MKKIIILIILACLVFPVFSQSAIQQRTAALSDSMGNTYSRSSAKLADYDSMIKDDGEIKMYTSYLRKYNSLVKALRESESRLDLYLRTNERSDIIRAERDNYEALVNQLQSVKSEYDSSMRR